MAAAARSMACTPTGPVGLPPEQEHAMTTRPDFIPAALVALAALAHDAAAQATGPAAAPRTSHQDTAVKNPHPYVGMWVTADGHVRHELLPNGRYDEARGRKKHAYQGSYTVTGNHIDYVDDTGFTADGEFVDGVLHHAGMVLHRER
jgi:hypothetical protein